MLDSRGILQRPVVRSDPAQPFFAYLCRLTPMQSQGLSSLMIRSGSVQLCFLPPYGGEGTNAQPTAHKTGNPAPHFRNLPHPKG